MMAVSHQNVCHMINLPEVCELWPCSRQGLSKGSRYRGEKDYTTNNIWQSCTIIWQIIL